jgi:hypothetical protein
MKTIRALRFPLSGELIDSTYLPGVTTTVIPGVTSVAAFEIVRNGSERVPGLWSSPSVET